MTTMFNKINSVDQAIAPLLTALTDLNNVADAQNSKIDRNAGLITELETEIGRATHERERAARIVKALEAIVDPKEGT
jgi:hypothetical protein